MRCRLSAVSLSLLAVLPSLAQAFQAEPARTSLEVLRVERYADDANAGSLRWAISTANQAPGRYRIEIAAVGNVVVRTLVPDWPGSAPVQASVPVPVT